MAVTVRTSTFFTRTKIRKLAEPRTDRRPITAQALALLDHFELDRPVRLLGVRLELARCRAEHRVAFRGYRSLRDLVLPLGPLTVVTGANGTGKSSVYRALMLLADCGRGEVIGSLAREGGLQSVLWAGPEQTAGARRTGTSQGTTRTRPVSLELGFASNEFGYLIDLGLPQYARAPLDVRPRPRDQTGGRVRGSPGCARRPPWSGDRVIMPMWPTKPAAVSPS